MLRNQFNEWGGRDVSISYKMNQIRIYKNTFILYNPSLSLVSENFIGPSIVLKTNPLIANICSVLFPYFVTF